MVPSFATFLEENQLQIDQLSQNIYAFTTSLRHKQNQTTRNNDYRYDLDHCFKTPDNKQGFLEFRVVRIEFFTNEKGLHQEFNKSTICDYSLHFAPPGTADPDSNKWEISEGMLTTYPGSPNKGFWKDTSGYPYNSKKGWGTLLFHMAAMAASMLNVDRTALLIHEGTRAIYNRYYTKYGTAKDLFHGVLVVKFTASHELTQYAKNLVREWLTDRKITFGMCAQTIFINPYMIK